MKHAILPFALFLLVLQLAVASDVPDTNQYYGPAGIMLWMPEDAQVVEEDGTWFCYSGSMELLLMFGDSGQYVEPDLVSETTLWWFEEVDGLEDFEMVAVVKDSLAYAYGQGVYRDEDGETQDTIFGILTNPAVPGKTFRFSIMSPSLSEPKKAKAVKEIIRSFAYSPAG